MMTKQQVLDEIGHLPPDQKLALAVECLLDGNADLGWWLAEEAVHEWRTTQVLDRRVPAAGAS